MTTPADTTPTRNHNYTGPDAVEPRMVWRCAGHDYPHTCAAPPEQAYALSQATHDLIRKAEERGYQRAIDALRDVQRYREWLATRPTVAGAVSTTNSESRALYLESLAGETS